MFSPEPISWNHDGVGERGVQPGNHRAEKTRKEKLSYHASKHGGTRNNDRKGCNDISRQRVYNMNIEDHEDGIWLEDERNPSIYTSES